MSLADDVIDAAPGTLTEYAGVSLPPGYLWANGAPVSRSAYARLFASLCVSISGVATSGSPSITSVSQDLTQLPTSLIGAPVSGSGIPSGATVTAVGTSSITISAAATASSSSVSVVIAPHGIGDGSTTFNVPDRRGRTGVGHDLMGTTAAGRITTAGSGVNGALLGASGGAETNTLTTAQLPSNTHANTLSDGTHAHGGNYQVGATTEGSSGTGGAGIFYVAQNENIPAAASNISINNAAIGSNSAHNNAQPSIVMNYIIKT